MPQQQQQPSQGQITDLLFPVNGVDIAVALEQQLPDTTPVGINVRAFEPQSMRARGGARQGLSKYLNDQLPLSYASGSRVIQNLTLVIDPTGLAVTPSFIDLPSTDFPWELDINLILIDGSYNTVAPGGSGNETAQEYKRKYPQLVIKANNQTKTQGDDFTWTGNEYTISHGSLQPGDSIFTVAFSSAGAAADAANGTYPIIPSKAVIRQVSTNKPYQVAYQNGTMTVSPGGIEFVQSASGGVFPNEVEQDNLIVVAVSTNSNDPGFPDPPASVTDTLGNVYSLAVAMTITYPSGSTGVYPWNQSVWYCISTSSGSCTISAGSNVSSLIGEEFSGVKTSSPFAGAVTNNGSLGPQFSPYSTNWSTGAVSGSAPGNLIISLPLLLATVVGDGETRSVNLNSPPFTIDDFAIAFLSSSPVSLSGTITDTETLGGINWFTYLVSFNHE